MMHHRQVPRTKLIPCLRIIRISAEPTSPGRKVPAFPKDDQHCQADLLTRIPAEDNRLADSRNPEQGTLAAAWPVPGSWVPGSLVQSSLVQGSLAMGSRWQCSRRSDSHHWRSEDLDSRCEHNLDPGTWDFGIRDPDIRDSGMRDFDIPDSDIPDWGILRRDIDPADSWARAEIVQPSGLNLCWAGVEVRCLKQ